MTWCEAHGVDYVFLLAKNARLIVLIQDELAGAATQCATTERPARVFTNRTSAATFRANQQRLYCLRSVSKTAAGSAKGASSATPSPASFEPATRWAESSKARPCEIRVSATETWAAPFGSTTAPQPRGRTPPRHPQRAYPPRRCCAHRFRRADAVRCGAP